MSGVLCASNNTVPFLFPFSIRWLNKEFKLLDQNNTGAYVSPLSPSHPPPSHPPPSHPLPLLLPPPLVNLHYSSCPCFSCSFLSIIPPLPFPPLSLPFTPSSFISLLPLLSLHCPPPYNFLAIGPFFLIYSIIVLPLLLPSLSHFPPSRSHFSQSLSLSPPPPSLSLFPPLLSLFRISANDLRKFLIRINSRTLQTRAKSIFNVSSIGVLYREHHHTCFSFPPPPFLFIFSSFFFFVVTCKVLMHVCSRECACTSVTSGFFAAVLE